MGNVPKILVIDDEHSVRWAFEKALSKAGYQAFMAETGLKGLSLFESLLPDLTMLDIRMPEMDGLQVLQKIREKNPNAKVIVMTAYSDMETTVSAMKLGAYDFLSKPFDIQNCLTLIQKGLQANSDQSLPAAEQHPAKSGILIGNSPCMQEIYKLIGKVSTEDVTVLITGESGSGKELVAQAIHYNSGRAGKPFWAVNCTAVAESLMEAELFGYEKGAFTGAVAAKSGVFELAQGGTLFLDEIGDMTLEMQSKLLRVLEEREFVRVGGSKKTKVDVRLISATNKDLRKTIEENRFREDLFHRIKVIEIPLPTLKQRVEDIPILANHFLTVLASQRKGSPKSFSEAALKTLSAYHWPGNVRELRNAIDQAYTLSRDPVIQPEHLPAEIRKTGLPSKAAPIAVSQTVDESGKSSLEATLGGGKVSPPGAPESPTANLIENFVAKNLLEGLSGRAYEAIMDQLEKELLHQALAHFKGNQVQTANYLGITRNTLRTKISKYNL